MNKKPTLKSSLQALLYLAPMLIFVSIFTIYPIFKSIDMSFYTKFNILSGEVKERGLENYQIILNDPEFHRALKNTFIYVIGVVPTTIFISLMIALMLNSIPFLKGFFRTVYFLPYVTSTVAVSIVWAWLYHSRYGIFNYILGIFGLDPVNWLNDPQNSLMAVMIMAVWKGLGFNILLLLVGLGNINENYYKAAKVDGASAFKRFTNITIPLLRPTLFLLSTLGVISSFKVFDEVFALFSGRPGVAGSAVTLVYYLYQKFYVEFKYGQAAATGIVLFLIVLGITLIQNAGNKYFEKRGG